MTSLTERKWSDRTRESRSLRLSQLLKAWSKLGSYERVIIHSQNADLCVVRSWNNRSNLRQEFQSKTRRYLPRRSTLRSARNRKKKFVLLHRMNFNPEGCFAVCSNHSKLRAWNWCIRAWKDRCDKHITRILEDRSQRSGKQWKLPLSLTGSAGGLNWQHEEQYYLKAVLFSLWYMWYTSRQHAALAATRGSQGDELRHAYSNDRGTNKTLLGWKSKRTPFLSPLSELTRHFISELHVHELYGTVPVAADRAADCPTSLVLVDYWEKNTLLEYLDCAEIATAAIDTYREKVNKFQCHRLPIHTNITQRVGVSDCSHGVNG